MTRTRKDAKRDGGWPPDVPVLLAVDVVWSYSTRSGRHDLLTWLERTFNPNYPADDSPNYRVAYETLCGVITERFGKRVTVLWTFMEFVQKNKLPGKDWLAACWNEMLSRLGYSVPRGAARDPGFKRHAR